MPLSWPAADTRPAPALLQPLPGTPTQKPGAMQPVSPAQHGMQMAARPMAGYAMAPYPMGMAMGMMPSMHPQMYAAHGEFLHARVGEGGCACLVACEWCCVGSSQKVERSAQGRVWRSTVRAESSSAWLSHSQDRCGTAWLSCTASPILTQSRCALLLLAHLMASPCPPVQVACRTTWQPAATPTCLRWAGTRWPWPTRQRPTACTVSAGAWDQCDMLALLHARISKDAVHCRPVPPCNHAQSGPPPPHPPTTWLQPMWR